jgi:hypothetical protein
MQSCPDPRRRLVIANPEYTAIGLGLGSGASSGDEGARERGIEETDRHGVVEHAPHSGGRHRPTIGAAILVEPGTSENAALVLDKIRRRFPWLELIWADGGYNAWQVEGVVAKVLLRAHGDCQAEQRHEGLRRPAAPLGGRAYLPPGSDETGVSPRTSRTLPNPWPPSLPSPPSSLPLGGSPGDRL